MTTMTDRARSRASTDIVAAARTELSAVTRDIEAAKTRRDLLLVHYDNLGVPRAQMAAALGISTGNRAALYQLLREAGVAIDPPRRGERAQALYDHLMAITGPEGGTVANMTATSVAAALGSDWTRHRVEHAMRALRQRGELKVVRSFGGTSSWTVIPRVS